MRSLFTGSSGTAYLILDVICAHISLCYFTLGVFNLQFKFYLSLAAYWNMDNNDEESQNSSENSFNEMVTAAIGAGFAFVHMLHVPPQGNHVMQVPELTGRQWVDKLLSDAMITTECGLKIWLGCIAYCVIAVG